MEVFSFGNGDFLFQIFTAIVGIMGDGSYTTLMRIAILFGFLFLAYQLMFSLNIVHISRSVVSYIAFFFIIHGLFYIPKRDVIINDVIKNTQVVVSNVPYGVGMFAHLFTSLEKGLTKMMENYFSVPADMRFSKTGYAFSVMLLDSFKDVVPADPYFSQSLNDFVKDCFFHDVLWGDKDLKQVVEANNIWSMMSPGHSRHIYTKTYSRNYPAGQAVLCSNAYSTLNSNLGTMTNNALTTMNRIMQIDIATALPAVFNRLLGISSVSATSALQQAMVSNALKSSFAQTAMYVGSGAGAIPYASGIAEQTQRTSWTVAGDLSKKYIPILRQVLEAFVYGLFPIMFLMMLTPIGSKYIQTYLTLLFWLLMWSPLYAILNLIVNTRAEGVLSATYGKFSIGSMPFVYQSVSELTAMAGYMAWMVPTVAYALAKGSEHAVTSLASSVASSVSFTAKSAGSEASSPSAADRIASFAATAAAQQIHGSEAMQGMAANKFFQIQQGMSMGASGLPAMGNVANTEWSARNIDAQKLQEVAGQHGITPTQAQGLMASDKYQQALTSAGARKAFAEDFAKQHGASVEAGYQFLADTHIAGSRAINQVWGNNAQGYAAYLATGHNISLGQQEGLVKAAQEMGIDVRNFAQMSSFMDNVKKSGAMQLLQDGKITGDDLKMMGSMGLLSEKGMAEGAQRIADATGMSYDQAKAYLTTREGLNEFAKFKALDNAMEKVLGMSVTDKNALEFAMGRHASVSTTLTEDQARALTENMQSAGYKNFQAKAGDRATFAFDPQTGNVSVAYADRGGKVSQFDVSSIDKGRRERIGDDIKTGNQRERVNIDKSTTDTGTYILGGTKRDVTNTNFTGNRSAHYNESAVHGVFSVKDPNTGEKINVQGSWYFNPETRELVSASYTNLQTAELFTAQKVMDRGEEKMQFGVGKIQIGPDGKMVQSFNSLSSRSVATGGYASQQTFAPDGTKLYEKADAGQQVTWWHQFMMQHQKGANLSVLGFFAPGSDLTNLNSLQINAIYGGGVFYTTAKGLENIAGVITSGKNIKNYKDLFKNTLPTVPRQSSTANRPILFGLTANRPILFGPDGRPIR